jgi:CubicO group peptidase (beta-lactamase class C family)
MIRTSVQALLASALLGVALCAGCTSTSPSGGSFTAPALSDEQVSSIDAYLTAEMSERRIPGLAYGIVRDGQLVHVGTHGVANIQHQVPVKPETVFELASLTKAMTAAAIMLLVEEGRVNLDASIAEYLDDPPQAWRAMTVRQVLTHTAGLAAIHKGFTGGITKSRVSAADAYAAARPDPIAFSPPGAQFVYSDVGYIVLGMIIERASDMTYRQFMTERIFQPLGMGQTRIKDPLVIVPDEAQGYTIRNGELVNIGRWRHWDVPSAWGVMSTVADLAKWSASMDNDSLLSEASRRQIFAPGVLNDGSSTRYGFGWFVVSPRGHRIQQHTGLTGTELVRLPDDGWCVIVLTNLGGWGPQETPEVNAWGMAGHIAQMLVPGLRRPPLVEVPLTRAQIDEVVGTYDGETPFRFYEQDGRIRVEVAGEHYRLVHIGDDVFADTDEDITLTLQRDPGGRVAAIFVENMDGWTERLTPRK